MSNHLHIIGKCVNPHTLSEFIRDFKRHTSLSIIKQIKDIPESRREWLLEVFSQEAKRSARAKHFKIWKDDNHAIWLGDIDIWEKINYIHENPVEAGIVDLPEHYRYSSAMDYANKCGLVKVEKLN